MVKLKEWIYMNIVLHHSMSTILWNVTNVVLVKFSKYPLILQDNQSKHWVFRDALKFQHNPNWYAWYKSIGFVTLKIKDAWLILLSLSSLYKYQSLGKPSLSITIPNKVCHLGFRELLDVGAMAFGSGLWLWEWGLCLY